MTKKKNNKKSKNTYRWSKDAERSAKKVKRILELESIEYQGENSKKRDERSTERN